MTCQICGHHRPTHKCTDRSETFEAEVCSRCHFPEMRDEPARHIMPEVSMDEMGKGRNAVLVCLRAPDPHDAANSKWELRKEPNEDQVLR
jgi:hypothetical protein